MLISLPAHTPPNLICIHRANNCTSLLTPSRLPWGSIIFLMIMVPRVRTELETQGSRWVQGVSQNDFTKCSTEIVASNHFLVMHGVPQRI